MRSIADEGTKVSRLVDLNPVDFAAVDWLLYTACY
jgi:hypothetical protein